eukprot:jgi/Mesvir1/26828/Mv20586-RA.1
MAGKVIRSVMRETSPETTMFTANDYRFIREKLATVSVGECGNKRVRPFQLPNIIRKRKKQEPPTVTRALFSTPGLGHLEKSWKSSVPVSENSPPDDSEPPPLSDSLVGTPELGEYSRMTWRAFGDLLNGMDCRALTQLSGRSEYHAVAVSLAMGLQGVSYCFSGCRLCDRSPRWLKRTAGLAE